MALPTSHLHILLTLATEDRHGYSIMRETEELTDGQVKLGPGALYAALGKLTDDGLVVETEERPAPELDDARRRYYRITDAGRSALGVELQRLQKVIAYARNSDLGWSPT
ncbi:MAG: PadR family transcriptional regulator [Acidimicrobiia bacterium]